MTNILNIDNLSKVYRLGNIDVPVLFDINLNIDEGEFIAIMGPSGSGKSTLMNIIGCLDRPTSGKIKIGNTDISTLSDIDLAIMRGRKIGFIFQTFNLISRYTTLENVELPMIYQNIPRSDRLKRANYILDILGLRDRINHRPTELSGGQRQRVAIARALVNEPEILLADEPTGNLDSKTGIEIIRIFDDLHKNGKTIIMVTHNNELTRYCNRVITLKDGRILENKT